MTLYRHIQADHGDLFSGPSNSQVHFPTGNEIVAPGVDRLIEFTNRATDAAKLIRPEVLNDHLMQTAGGLLFGTAGQLIDAARRERREVAERTVALSRPAGSIDMSNKTEHRTAIRARELPDQLVMVETVSVEALAAYVEPGNVANLPEVVLQRARDRFIVENFIAANGTQGGFPMKPHLDDISAIGSDLDAARRAVEASIAHHAKRVEQVALTESVLKHLIGYTAAALGITPDDALDRALRA